MYHTYKFTLLRIVKFPFILDYFGVSINYIKMSTQIMFGPAGVELAVLFSLDININTIIILFLP